MDERSATILTLREREIFGAVMEVLQDGLRQRDAQIAALEARLATLEAKTLADSFKGSWLPGSYEKGALVQRGNGVWLCMRTTSEQPGHSPSWRQLAGPR